MGAESDDLAALTVLERLALDAGRTILRFIDAGFAVETKSDSTPVTAADRAAETVIVEGLERAFPGAAIVAEEQFAAGLRPPAARAFFLVDALDGTREFVAGRPDFTVNIGYVEDGVPRLGVVFAPAHRLLWTGRPGAAAVASDPLDPAGASRRAIAAAPPARRLRILASRSHRTPQTEAFLARYPDAAHVAVGSSMKFCRIAAGEADLYPRFGRTMEWDTAAGDAILRAAGGRTETLDGKSLVYGKAPDYANGDFIARGA